MGRLGAAGLSGRSNREQAGGFRCIDVEHALSWTVARALQRLPVRQRANTVSSVHPRVHRSARHTLCRWKHSRRSGRAGAGALMLGADVPLDAILDAVERRPRRVSGAVVADRRTADRAVGRGGRCHCCRGVCRRAGLGLDGIAARWRRRVDSLRSRSATLDGRMARRRPPDSASLVASLGYECLVMSRTTVGHQPGIRGVARMRRGRKSAPQQRRPSTTGPPRCTWASRATCSTRPAAYC